jgi:hypothetical protein
MSCSNYIQSAMPATVTHVHATDGDVVYVHFHRVAYVKEIVVCGFDHHVI